MYAIHLYTPPRSMTTTVTGRINRASGGRLTIDRILTSINDHHWKMKTTTEDGHHLGGVPVSSGVHVDQLGRLSHLDEDRSVGKGDCTEDKNLDDAHYLGENQLR